MHDREACVSSGRGHLAQCSCHELAPGQPRCAIKPPGSREQAAVLDSAAPKAVGSWSCRVRCNVEKHVFAGPWPWAVSGGYGMTKRACHGGIRAVTCFLTQENGVRSLSKHPLGPPDMHRRTRSIWTGRPCARCAAGWPAPIGLFRPVQANAAYFPFPAKGSGLHRQSCGAVPISGLKRDQVTLPRSQAL